MQNPFGSQGPSQIPPHPPGVQIEAANKCPWGCQPSLCINAGARSPTVEAKDMYSFCLRCGGCWAIALDGTLHGLKRPMMFAYIMGPDGPVAI